MRCAADPTELTEDMMKLSNISKTIDGSGFAYTSLSCTAKNVRSVSILEQYAALRTVDLSDNRIQDVNSVGKLECVLSVCLADNSIRSIDCWRADQLLHLRFLDLSNNQLQSLPSLKLPALRKASFAGNQISTCEGFLGHPRLMQLDLSGNCLPSLAGVGDMPCLQTLSVARQQNSCLLNADGLAHLPALISLDISGNGLTNLDGPWEEMPLLSTLNVSTNAISAVSNLEGVAHMAHLVELLISPNPVDDVELSTPLRIEVLILSPKLQSMNGEAVEEQEREDAISTHEQRVEDENQRRLELEEAERAKLEGCEGDAVEDELDDD